MIFDRWTIFLLNLLLLVPLMTACGGWRSGGGASSGRSTIAGQSAIPVAGSYYSLELKPDGSLWEWGDNEHGQLGDGANTQRNAPVQVGSGYIAASAGGGTTSVNKVASILVL